MNPETAAALSLAGLHPDAVRDLAARAVAEDLAGGVDVTSVATVPADLRGVAAFVPRQPGVVAGVPVALAVVELVGDVEVLEAGADLVLLDNMTLDELRECVALCRAQGVLTEASGGLSLDTARAVEETGVDFLAVGALTHSAPVLDLGVDLRTTERGTT